MKAVVQRVTRSSVTVEGEIIGKIEKGFNILLGVEETDEKEDAEILAAKIAKLRVFEDEQGKMNLALTDVGGSALVVSQFTLCADIRKGNRPSFTPAAKPDKAVPLYEYFMAQLKLNGIETKIFSFKLRAFVILCLYIMLCHGPLRHSTQEYYA